jgi:S-adenosylmethionine synthetase
MGLCWTSRANSQGRDGVKLIRTRPSTWRITARPTHVELIAVVKKHFDLRPGKNVSYAIGIAEPLAINVEDYGTPDPC